MAKNRKIILTILIIFVISLPAFILQISVNNNIKELEKSGKLDSAYASLGYIDKKPKQESSTNHTNINEDIILSTSWYGAKYVNEIVSEDIFEYKIIKDTLFCFQYVKARNFDRSALRAYREYYTRFSYKLIFLDSSYVLLNSIDDSVKSEKVSYELMSINNKLSLILYTENHIGSKYSYIRNTRLHIPKYIMLFAENNNNSLKNINEYEKTTLMGYSIGDSIKDFSNLYKPEHVPTYFLLLNFDFYTKKTDFGLLEITTLENLIINLKLKTDDPITITYLIDYLNQKFRTNYPKNQNAYYWNKNNVVVRKKDPVNYEVHIYDIPEIYLLFSTTFKNTFSSD